VAEIRIPAEARDLFTGQALAHLATITESGRPAVTPVWIDLDGNTVLVNSSKGRVKNRLMDVGARVALSITDIERPYRFVSVQGDVVARTEEGAAAQLERLSQRYLGKPYPWWRPGEVRELFHIRPTHVTVRNFG
jgi:PPOX class probable F420-dependent enzyme